MELLWPILKASHTALALTALVLAVRCGHAALQGWRQPVVHPGTRMTALVALWALDSLWIYGPLAWAYWVGGVDHRLQLPIWWLLVGHAGFLTVGAGFLALVTPEGHSARRVFWRWSASIAALIVLITAIGIGS